MKHLLLLFFISLPLMAQDSYDSLLKKHVSLGTKEGIQAMLVNYQAWGKDPLHVKAMKKYTSRKPHSLKAKEKMTYWINAYNLLTIDLIITQKEKKSIRNLGSFLSSPWKKHSWKIAGKKYTLHQIEHEILRPMGDPRIHMAINCASISCPDLRAEAYTVEALDKQLDEQVKLFLKNSKKGVQQTQGGLVISKIFDWFEDDWQNEKGVLRFIAKNSKYRSREIDDYLDYNWNLNSK